MRWISRQRVICYKLSDPCCRLFVNVVVVDSLQIYPYPNLNLQTTLDAMNGQRVNSHKNRHAHAHGPVTEQLPYIPQPDYTPLPVRRMENMSHQTVRPILPRVVATRVPAPQWNFSQFPAHEWDAALMKRLSIEARNRREESIRKEANMELERFESEIDLYLESCEDAEECADEATGGSTTPTSSSITSTPPCPTSISSSSPGAVEAATDSETSAANPIENNRSRDRDQISLESGYMSSYPGDTQRSGNF